jgi:fatty acid desaturase
MTLVIIHITPNKTLNYLIGSIAGILTCGVSMNWILDHSTHHMTSGDDDK